MIIQIDLNEEEAQAVNNFAMSVMEDPDNPNERALFYKAALMQGFTVMHRDLINRTAQMIKENPELINDLAAEMGVDPSAIDLSLFGIQETTEVDGLGPISVNKPIIDN